MRTSARFSPGPWRPELQKRLLLTTFAELGVVPEICAALASAGIVDAFAVQELTLPVALTGADVIGQARTGTGKTLAFGIPLLQRIVAPDEPDYVDLVEPGKPQALVIAPTRELAIQVAGDLRAASTVRRVRVLNVYGGRSYEPQVEALAAGVDVVVGTPGRMLDLVRQGVLDLGHVKVLVLDEADEMLDLGFLPDVERLLAQTPELRQTMLFSATMPSSVVQLARAYMRHPVNVRAESPDETATVPTTAQFVYRAHNLDKDELLARLLQAEGRGLCLVFTRTKRQAQRVADEMDRRGFAAASVHGDLGQGAREQALRAFRSGKVDVLVATDVAARGIDVQDVTHVVNYSCPEDEKTYLHRIGRTGRAGASGIAVTYVDWEDVARWKVINSMLSLPYDEPPETYSSSEAYFHDLGIAAGTTGVLPRSGRTRAGLDAEEIEDLGETGKGPSSRAPARGRPRSRPAEAEPRDSRPTRPTRQRRRTRRGDPGATPAEGGSVSDQPGPDEASPRATAGDTTSSASNSATTGRPRRRRGRGRGTHGTAGPASDAARDSAGDAAATGDS